jgi:hypothetical protein
MSGLVQDLRYALRQLRKNVGFAIVTMLHSDSTAIW